MEMKPNTIAFFLLLVVSGMSMYLFAASRNDPSLRIAMLVSATGTVAGMLAIASTLLTGKDVTKRDPADIPPGTVTTDTSVIKTASIPPVTTTSTETVVEPKK